MSKKGIFIPAFLTLLICLSTLSQLSFRMTLAQNTFLYIDPQQTAGLDVGDTFVVNVTVADVFDLYGWQFSLYYRGDVLNVTDVTEGPFLKTHPETDETMFLTPILTDSYNATHGLIIASGTLVEVSGGVSGSGTLASIQFKVKESGSSTLHLTGTKLVDSTSPFGNLIPHAVRDGQIYCGVRDVAVVSVGTSDSQVYEGQTLNITVMVANKGEHIETFTVTTYYDTNVISAQQVNNLAPRSHLTLTFSWDTRGVEPNVYTVKAEASAVPGETNLEDNSLIGDTVTVRSYAISLITISQVVSVNQSGYPVTRFKKGLMAYFKVVVNNTSSESEIVLVTVNAYDSNNTTLGVVSFKGSLMPGISTFILGLPIPAETSTGIATVYANVFTDWPYYGGIPYCPEGSTTFEISSS